MRTVEVSGHVNLAQGNVPTLVCDLSTVDAREVKAKRVNSNLDEIKFIQEVLRVSQGRRVRFDVAAPM